LQFGHDRPDFCGCKRQIESGCDIIGRCSIEVEGLTKKFVLNRGLLDFVTHPLDRHEITSLQEIYVEFGRVRYSACWTEWCREDNSHKDPMHPDLSQLWIGKGEWI